MNKNKKLENEAENAISSKGGEDEKVKQNEEEAVDEAETDLIVI